MNKKSIKVNTIKEIKELQNNFNKYLLKLSLSIPDIEVHIANINHPKFNGNKDSEFITIWGHNKKKSTKAF